MRRFFRVASRMFPSSVIIKGIGTKTILPFYHMVSDTPPFHVNQLYKVLSVKAFERDLDYFLNYFTPIGANDLIRLLNNEVALDKPSVFLSFDDGFREVKETIAPILLRKGLPAAFFVNPVCVGNNDLMYRCKVSLIANRIEAVKSLKSTYADIASLLNTPNDVSKIKKQLFLLKHSQGDVISKIAELIDVDFNEYLRKNQPYLTLDDLQSLSQLGFTIGGHGYNHPYFNEISFEEQVLEVKRCMQWVGFNFPNQPKLFAFPFTDCGVSDDLLKRIVSEQDVLCDLSFGTSGIQPIRFHGNLQRIPMEVNSVSGKRLVNAEILYYLAKKSLGYYKIKYDRSL